MIEVVNLHKKFGKFSALSNINLVLGTGQCVALVGPNGCGKTTLIKSILGLVVPQQGQILIDGQSIIHQHSHRAKLGYMPQIGRYPGNLTIGQLINMVRNLRPHQNHYDEELIDLLGIHAILSKKMSALSGGTIQKVSAILAFLFDPDILILDEPTAGLDPLSAEILKMKIEKAVKKGKLVLITSHILSELDELVTQVVFMQEGQIILHRAVDQLISETGQTKLSKAIISILNRKVSND
ncbi:MAG: ABC transporter ATP-binding protein [Saprospiraceae bacterium]